MSQWPTFYRVCRTLARGLRDCPQGKEPDFVVDLMQPDGKTIELHTREFNCGVCGMGCYPGAKAPHNDVAISFGTYGGGVTLEWHLLQRSGAKDLPTENGSKYKQGADKEKVVLALAEYLRYEKLWEQGPDPNPLGTSPLGFTFKCQKTNDLTGVLVKVEYITSRKRRIVVSDDDEEEEDDAVAVAVAVAEVEVKTPEPTEWTCPKCVHYNPWLSKRCSKCAYHRDAKRARTEE